MDAVELIGGNGNLFESMKRVNEHGREYWSARDIQPHLGYSEWRNFAVAVKKAIVSCRESGNEPGHHLVELNRFAVEVFGLRRVFVWGPVVAVVRVVRTCALAVGRPR